MLADSATHYWRFEETGGTFAEDSAGTNHGTYVSSPSLGVSDGKSVYTGRQATFSGIPQYMQTATEPEPADFSVEMWFKTTSVTGCILFQSNGTVDGSSGCVDATGYLNDSGKVHFAMWPASLHTIQSAAAYNDGNWHHYVATMSSTTGMELYIDGALVGSDGNTDSYNCGAFWTIAYGNGSGIDFAPTSYHFIGTLDEVAIYPAPLTGTQILNHYQLRP